MVVFCGHEFDAFLSLFPGPLLFLIIPLEVGRTGTSHAMCFASDGGNGTGL